MSEHDRPQDAGALSRGAQGVGGCDSRRARGVPGKVTRTSRMAGGNAVQRRPAASRPVTSPAAAHASARDTAGHDEPWGDAMAVWEQTYELMRARPGVAHGSVVDGRADAGLARAGRPGLVHVGAGEPSQPGAPAVQRRSLPGDQAGSGTGAEAGDEQEAPVPAADDVEALLDRPDPVAGIGDPAGALRLLATLPMGEILAVLDALDARGRLSEIVSRLDQGDADADRVRVALRLRSIAGMRTQHIPDASLAAFAEDLQRVSDSDQSDVYRYVMSRRQVTPELRMTIEGAMVMQGASGPGASPMTAPGAMAGATMPAPIEPAPFEPGRQRPELYMGNAAHKGIGAHYVEQHRGEAVFLNYVPMSSLLKELMLGGQQVNPSALSASERARRPDVSNLTLRHLYEIRPWTQQAEARATVSLYLGLYAKGGFTMSLGPTGDPGATGQLPAPDGVFIFWSPEPGVILYEYRKGRLVPVPVPAAERGKQKQPAREWRWELEPLTRAQEQALLTGAAGTALLILMMLLLAPVGA